VYAIGLSETAERTVESLSSAEAEEFREIEEHLARHLPALKKAGLVTPLRFFEIDGFRYFDHKFPYFILFETASEAEGYPFDVLMIQLILPALVDPPTQTMV